MPSIKKRKGSGKNDVYSVEKLMAKRLVEGKLQYLVKWEGYGESENTWEFAENILSPELIHDFEMNQSASKAEPVKATTTQRQKNFSTNKATKLISLGEWEDRVVKVLTVDQDRESGELLVHLLWAGGRDSIHPAKVVNKACPLKVIEFYEQHVKFRPRNSSDGEGASSHDEVTDSELDDGSIETNSK